MSIAIITQFKTKDGRAEELVALIERLIDESSTRPGFESVSVQRNQDDPNDVISNQRWTSRRHYEEYFAWRSKNGVTAQFDDLLVDPISMRYFDIRLERDAAR